MQTFNTKSKLFRDSLQEKKRYKMYKKGKFWLTASMSLLYAGILLSQKVNTVSASTADEPVTDAKTTAAAPKSNTAVLQSSKTAADTSAAKQTKTQAASAANGDASQAAAQTAAQANTKTPAQAASTAKAQPAASAASAKTAVSGIAATIQDQTKAEDDNAASDPTTYNVTLADGLQAPAWTASDFDLSGITSQKAGTYTIKLSAAGLAKLQAANPTKNVTEASVQPGRFTITAKTAAATAQKQTATAAAADKTKTAAPVQAAEAAKDTKPAAAPNRDSLTTAKNLADGATKTVAQMDGYVKLDDAMAAASTTDTIVNNDAMKALQTHLAGEKQQVQDLTAAVQKDPTSDPAATLTNLTKAAQLLNTMNQELTQAASMFTDDKNGAKVNVKLYAQAALAKASLPAGASGKVDNYGDLTITAPDDATYQAAVQALKDQGLSGAFRQIVDPDQTIDQFNTQLGNKNDTDLTLKYGERPTTVDAMNTASVFSAADNEKEKSVAIQVKVKAGDKITVTVPWMFNAKSDNVMGVQQSTTAATAAENAITDGAAHKDTVFTYTADQDGMQNFNVSLEPNVDLDDIKDGSLVHVNVNVNNGQKTGSLGYQLENTIVNLKFGIGSMVATAGGENMAAEDINNDEKEEHDSQAQPDTLQNLWTGQQYVFSAILNDGTKNYNTFNSLFYQWDNVILTQLGVPDPNNTTESEMYENAQNFNKQLNAYTKDGDLTVLSSPDYKTFLADIYGGFAQRSKLTGSITIKVPDGFQLIGGNLVDLNGTGNNTLKTTTGDQVIAGATSTNISPLTNDGSFTQSAVGAPITLTLPADGASVASVLSAVASFYGTYTKPLTADQNVFSISGNLQRISTDGNQNPEPITINAQTQAVEMAVDNVDQLTAKKDDTTTSGSDNTDENKTTTVIPQATFTLLLTDNYGSDDTYKLYYDPVEPDGSARSANVDGDQYSYISGAQRGYAVTNYGLVDATNYKLSIQSGGTQALDLGGGKYGYRISQDKFDPLKSVAVDYQNGTSKTYTLSDLTQEPADAQYWDLLLPAGDNGSDVKQIDITWSKIVTNQILPIWIMSNNIDAPLGKKITTSVTLTSDQMPKPESESNDFTVANPPLKTQIFGATAAVSPDQKVYHQGDPLTVKASLGETIKDKLGVYYLTLPQETDLATGDLTKDVTWDADYGIPAIGDDLTDLGKVGPKGQRVLKLDLSTVNSNTAEYIEQALTQGKAQNNALPLGFTLNLKVDDNAMPLVKTLKSSDIIKIQSSANDTKTQTASKQSVTYGGQKVDVVTPVDSVKLSTEDTPSTYSIVLPSFLGPVDGIDDPLSSEVKYLQYNANDVKNTTARYSVPADIANIELVSVNSTDNSSDWTQNVVVLPSKANGDPIDVQLKVPAGQATPGTIVVPDTANDQALLYSTQAVTTLDGQKFSESSFVTADKVTDWSKVKAVMLRTGKMTAGDTAVATLATTVPNVAVAAKNSPAVFPATFKGLDEDGKVFEVKSQLAAEAVDTTTVTTNWVKLAADGTRSSIKDPVTKTYAVGDPYTTAPLTIVPDGLKLVATEGTASGTTTTVPVTVTYVYAPKEDVTIHFIDVSKSTKTSGWTKTDGSEVTPAVVLSGDATTAYTNDADGNAIPDKIPAGYVLAATGSFDKGAVSGNYDADPKAAQDYYVYVKKAQTDQVGSVKIIDDTITDPAKKTLSTVALAGKSGDPIDYTNAKTQVNTYLGKGYALAKGETSVDTVVNGFDKTFDDDAANSQDFEIHLVHQETVVNPPSNPGNKQPGDPADPTYPNGPKVSDLYKAVTETVHYVEGATGNKLADDKTATAGFTRTAKVDAVTGALIPDSYSAWTPNSTTLKAIPSPVIEGYIADKAQEAEVPNVTDATKDADVTFTVHYTALSAWEPEGGKPIKYPNDPTDPTKPMNPTDPNYPSIPGKPGMTPQGPDGKNLTPDGKGGYVPPVPNDPTKPTPITYKTNNKTGDETGDQKGSVTFIDDTTKKTLTAVALSGNSDAPIDYTAAKTQLANYEKAGYIVVSGDINSFDKTFDDDAAKAQDFEIHLAHQETVVNPPSEPGNKKPGDPADPQYPNGPKVSDLYKAVVETVHYVEGSTGTMLADDKTATASFTRTAKVDTVTGALIPDSYSAWTPNSTTLQAIPSPIIDGYIADKAQEAEVPNVTSDTKDADVTFTVHYTALGSWEPAGGKPIKYPNDPKDPSKPMDPSDPNYPSIPGKPGMTPQGPDGKNLTPDGKGGYVPPVPTDPTKSTPITYTNNTPDNGGNTTPNNGGNTTPNNGGNTTPNNGGNTTPNNGGNTTPDNGGNTTPNNGGNTTPDNGGNTTPGNPLPDTDAGTPVNGNGNTTPNNGGTTPGNPLPDTNAGTSDNGNGNGNTTPEGGMLPNTNAETPNKGKANNANGSGNQAGTGLPNTGASSNTGSANKGAVGGNAGSGKNAGAANAGHLPQTGDDTSAELGAAGAMILASLGLLVPVLKKREDK